MTNVLVTGSNGQLGSELKLLAPSFPQLRFLFHDIDTLDITNAKALENFLNKHKPSFIINCAAYTAVDKAESEQEKAFLINEKAVKNIANAASKYSSKIIHISTDYIFDGTSSRPYREDDITNPVSVYGKSKLAGEKHLAGLQNTITIRTAWLYSVFGNNFVKTMLRLGKEKGSIKVVCDQIGNPTYAADLAKVVIKVLTQSVENPEDFKPGIYHYSNEGVCSWFDLASEIMNIKGLNCNIIPIDTSEYPTPAARPAYSVFNKSKIKTTFDIQIPWWKDSLRTCLSKL